MIFQIKELYVPEEPKGNKNPLDNAIDMQKKAEEYAHKKLGDNFSHFNQNERLKLKCPLKCGARILDINGQFLSEDKTKNVLLAECLRCASVILIYGELTNLTAE